MRNGVLGGAIVGAVILLALVLIGVGNTKGWWNLNLAGKATGQNVAMSREAAQEMIKPIDKRFDTVDQEVKGVDARVGQVETRVQTLEKKSPTPQAGTVVLDPKVIAEEWEKILNGKKPTGKETPTAKMSVEPAPSLVSQDAQKGKRRFDFAANLCPNQVEGNQSEQQHRFYEMNDDGWAAFMRTCIGENQFVKAPSS